MLADTQDGFAATIDSIPVVFGAKDHTSLTTSLAAAMFLAGRADEARALIEKDPELPSERKLVDCLYRARTAKDPARDLKTCSDGEDQHGSDPNVDSLILSWALSAPLTDLNLRNNEIGVKGAKAIAAALPR